MDGKKCKKCKKCKNKTLYSTTMAPTTASVAGCLRFPVGIKVVFACFIRVIVPRVQVLDDRGVRKIFRPPTPFTDLKKWPALFTNKPLTSTTSKAMTAVHSRIDNPDIEEIVSKPLEDLARRLSE